MQTHNVLYAPKGNHIHEEDVFTEDEDVDISKVWIFASVSLSCTTDSQAYLRVECQTVNRLPQTRAIFFSFKTYLFPIAEVKAEDSGRRWLTPLRG